MRIQVRITDGQVVVLDLHLLLVSVLPYTKQSMRVMKVETESTSTYSILLISHSFDMCFHVTGGQKFLRFFVLQFLHVDA